MGDVLVLREFDPEQDDVYTGQIEERQITFLLSEEDYGVIHGFAAIGFGEVVHHGDLPADGPYGRPAGPTGTRRPRTTPPCAPRTPARWPRATPPPPPAARPCRSPRTADTAVAEAAEAEAAFHAAAAKIVQGK